MNYNNHLRPSILSTRRSKVSNRFVLAERKSKTKQVSISMFILSTRLMPMDGGGDLSVLIYKIQTAIKSIAAVLKKIAFINNIRDSNKSKKMFNLVKTCDEIFLNALSSSGATCILATNTCENEYYVEEKFRGEYVVTFVPLDGDLTHQTAPLGSIFTIFRRSMMVKLLDTELMQFGKNIVACGYALYGPLTSMVLALGHGVGAHLFKLDPDTKEFMKWPEPLTVPRRGCYYSANEGLSVTFTRNVQKYFKLKKDVKKSGHRNQCIFSGSLVTDFHFILINGGIVIRPSYRDVPKGRFMHQFHVNPLSFIMTEAGGLAYNGKTEVLNFEVTKPREFCPMYCGSVEEVAELLRFTSTSNYLKTDTSPQFS